MKRAFVLLLLGLLGPMYVVAQSGDERVTDAEITAAKVSWLQAQEVSRAQDRELIGRIQTQTHYGRTMAWDAELQKKVQALTPQQIVEALRRHVDLTKMTFMKGGDFKKAGVTP